LLLPGFVPTHHIADLLIQEFLFLFQVGDHPLYRTSQGPYRLIRHPGYLGTIFVWVGFALAIGNWIATIILAMLLFGVYRYRIHSEETMLIDRFGNEYQEYRKQTWRLLPFIY
jgi:protein-S-isoprenylcysteine O-methyltransferase Ste14